MQTDKKLTDVFCKQKLLGSENFGNSTPFKENRPIILDIFITTVPDKFDVNLTSFLGAVINYVLYV